MAVRALSFLSRNTSRLCRSGTRGLSVSVSLLTNHNDHAPTRGPPYTTDFSAARTSHTSTEVIPTYRIMDAHGSVIDPKQDPQLSKDVLLRMYQKMVTLTIVDENLFKAQRMGLISFYMMASGEEATHFGSAAALEDQDMIYAQFRELGVLMWRGFTVDNIMDQCFSTKWEQGKGRQMPVHYGSKEHHYQTVSSCVGNQIPQAPGYAYGLKLSGSQNCACVYFGDGGAQTGDSHAAMNIAATLGCPVVFFCRNNGYAISTPVEDNYAGDGIASRGQGYGIEAIRVDGNDALAVYKVTKYAREVAVKEHRPVLIEAMTYRSGSHSSSDDQSRYQPMDIVKQWIEGYNPLDRLRGYLQQKGLWDQGWEEELRAKVKEEVMMSMQRARGEPKPHLDMLFTDVYDQIPPRLEKQRRQMWEHVQKYKDHYPLEDFES